MLAEQEAVVRREQNQGVAELALLPQCGDDLTHTLVDRAERASAGPASDGG
jgi:hypothetical protein